MAANLSDPDTGNGTRNDLNPQPVVITSGPIFDATVRNAFEIFVYPFAFVVAYIVIGLIGNIVVVYIFSFKWRKNKNTVFILTLAFLDVFSCAVNMPVEATILFNFVDYDHHLICKISRYTTYIVSASYSFVLVTIAVDRFMMVCRPFRGKNLDVSYTKRTCIGVVCLSVLTQWPSLFFYGTYTSYIPLDSSLLNATVPVLVEIKTCLVSNNVVDVEANHKYLYAFYAFLFIGHVLIFVVFISLYMHIGRKLFLASQVSMEEPTPRTKLWRMSVVSAFTGVLPRSALCSRGSRTMSSDNVSTAPRRPHEYRRKHSRQMINDIDRDNQVSYISNGDMTCCTAIRLEETDLGNIECLIESPDRNRKLDDGQYSSVTGSEETLSKGRDSLSVSTKGSKRNSARESLRLNIAFDVNDIKDSDPRFSKASSVSAGSERPLLPFTPQTAPSEGAKPFFLRRSKSEDLSARFSVSQIGANRKFSTDIKEISLKQNTLIMRMVTICYMLSYLPFLVIVCIRYTHPHIPKSLTGAPLIIYHVFLRSYFLNSVIRPFIYLFMNYEYRHKVCDLIRCRLV